MGPRVDVVLVAYSISGTGSRSHPSPLTSCGISISLSCSLTQLPEKAVDSSFHLCGVGVIQWKMARKNAATKHTT